MNLIPSEALRPRFFSYPKAQRLERENCNAKDDEKVIGWFHAF